MPEFLLLNGTKSWVSLRLRGMCNCNQANVGRLARSSRFPQLSRLCRCITECYDRFDRPRLPSMRRSTCCGNQRARVHPGRGSDRTADAVEKRAHHRVMAGDAQLS